MDRLRRHRPSPALVVACLALAIALGGTSYAAVVLPAGSVGTRQLQNGAVIEPKVKDHSLLARDFARGQLPAGPEGPQGIPGAAGASGAPGPKGDPATKLFAIIKPAVPNPTVGAQSGGVGVGHGDASGEFEVTFPQDVSKCVAVGSVTDSDGGMVAAVPVGGNTVRVQTLNAAGGAQDEQFAVSVFC
jgi:hypothetical protein